MIVSQIGTFIGFLILGFANALPIIFLARIIDGLSGANVAAAQAALTDSTSEKTRALPGFSARPSARVHHRPRDRVRLADPGGNDYHVPAFVAARVFAGLNSADYLLVQRELCQQISVIW